MSNLGACYEGIQRTYRNAVVAHLRSSLMRAHPSDYGELLKKPFQKEWDKLRASADERRLTGEISSPLADEFDLLGVNHFFNLFDSYYDDLCPRPNDYDKVQKSKERQALLGWVRTIKSLRDPLSHPSEEDFSFEDSFILLDCARRTLNCLGLMAAASRVKELMDSLSGRPLSLSASLEPLQDKLPPQETILVDFVGRGEELRQLREWFEDPLRRRWALSGEGGTGKSAIAYQFGRAIKFEAPEPYQIVLWLSAKKKQFREGQLVTIDRPDFQDLESALSWILTQYGWDDETGNPTETKRARVLQLLNEFPALLIVDDIDSLEEPEEAAIEFFTLQVPQTKSKLLLTSRRVLFGMGGSTTYVRGFSEPDGQAFIASRSILMELDASMFTPAVTRAILHVTDSSPLYIEDVLRFLAVLPASEAIRVWKDKGGAEARKYALKREFDLLTRDARHALLAVCIAPGAVSFLEIAAVTELSEGQLSAALSELQRLFLVPKTRLIEGEQRLEVNLNIRLLVKEVLGNDDLYRRVEAARSTIAGELPKAGRSAVAGIVRQAVFCVRNNDYEGAERLLLSALERYLNDRDLVGILGWVYKVWKPFPRVTDAREKFKRAQVLGSTNEEMYNHWCRMELGEREWTRAANAAEFGLKRHSESRMLLYLGGYARSRLAKDLSAGLHYARASEEASRSQEHLRRALRAPDRVEAGDRDLTADIYRSLVLNCELLKDGAQMATLFRSWLRDYPEDPYARMEWERLSKKHGLPPLSEHGERE